MALYVGLSPQDALAKWYAIRAKAKRPDGTIDYESPKLTPEEHEDLATNMVVLAKENPDAWKLVRTGVNDPNDSDYFYAFNPSTGQWDRKEHQGYWSHPESWIQAGAGAGLGALGVANAIGAGSGAAASAGGGGAAGGGAGAGTGAGVGTGAAVAGRSLWDKLAGPIAVGGQVAGGLIGAKIGADAATDAAKISAESADKALALQKEMYEQQRADLAPYRNLGAGAVGRLGDLWGFQMAPTIGGTPSNPSVNVGDIPPGGLTIPSPAMSKPATASLFAPSSMTAQPGVPASGMVMLQAPTGQVKAVPGDQVDHYVRLGATRVG